MSMLIRFSVCVAIAAASLTMGTVQSMAAEVTRMSPDKEPGLMSPEDDGAVTLTLKNERKTTVSLFWINTSGGREPYEDLEAGDEREQLTFEGHHWVIVDDKGKTIGVYTTPAKNAEITVTAGPQVTLERIDLSTDQEEADEEAIALFVTNKTKGVVTMYWIDAYGDRNQYKDIAPGKQLEQRSFEGHVWIILDAKSTSLGIYRCTAEDAAIVIW